MPAIGARIHRGELTGSGLSRDAGFQQAHMSNFPSVSSCRISLRPAAPDWPVELVEIGHSKGFAGYIVGRVCHIAVEV